MIGRRVSRQADKVPHFAALRSGKYKVPRDCLRQYTRSLAIAFGNIQGPSRLPSAISLGMTAPRWV
jgi:hypothetical protein